MYKRLRLRNLKSNFQKDKIRLHPIIIHAAVWLSSAAVKLWVVKQNKVREPKITSG